MCGIAGIIHRNGGASDIGAEMTSMLQALKHRGPDSTGFALYGPGHGDMLIMRVKLAEADEVDSGIEVHKKLHERKADVEARIEELGGDIVSHQQVTDYALRYEIKYGGDLRALASYLEEIEKVEILSIGDVLELIKDLGDSEAVSNRYQLASFKGTHGIGHSRMATESDVDIKSAHPYWAFPFKDVSVVHNGQLTNYWSGRRALEHRGHRFTSNCDSELIAVYLADKIAEGMNLEEAMRLSVEDFDGVFTYLVATDNLLGMAKDPMAAKPMVLYESDDMIAMASEEMAIRAVIPREIDTSDPYESEVRVWDTGAAA